MADKDKIGNSEPGQSPNPLWDEQELEQLIDYFEAATGLPKREVRQRLREFAKKYNKTKPNLKPD